MSSQLVIPLVLIGLIEAILFLQRLKYKDTITKIRWFNTQLDILRALSFLYTSKHRTIKAVVNDFAAAFFLQNRFDSFIFITLPLGKEEIFRVSDNKYSYITHDKINTISYDRVTEYVQKQNVSNFIRLNKTLTPMEEYIIKYIEKNQSQLQTANNTLTIDLKKTIGQSIILNAKEQIWQVGIVMQLSYLGEKLGFLFFLSKNHILPSKYDTDFVNIIGNVLSLVIKRFQFDQLLSYQAQLKAVEVEW